MMILYSEKRKPKGFTLLEVMFALSILAVGLLAMASMQGVAMNADYLANRMSVANMLGQQVLEDLHARYITDSNLTTLIPAPGAVYDLDPATASNNITIRGAGVFTARYIVRPDAPVNGATQKGTTQITVRISYIDPTTNVETLTRTFTTYKMLR